MNYLYRPLNLNMLNNDWKLANVKKVKLRRFLRFFHNLNITGSNVGREPGSNVGREPGSNVGREPGSNGGLEPGSNGGREPGSNGGGNPKVMGAGTRE